MELLPRRVTGQVLWYCEDNCLTRNSLPILWFELINIHRPLRVLTLSAAHDFINFNWFLTLVRGALQGKEGQYTKAIIANDHGFAPRSMPCWMDSSSHGCPVSASVQPQSAGNSVRTKVADSVRVIISSGSFKLPSELTESWYNHNTSLASARQEMEVAQVRSTNCG